MLSWRWPSFSTPEPRLPKIAKNGPQRARFWQSSFTSLNFEKLFFFLARPWIYSPEGLDVDYAVGEEDAVEVVDLVLEHARVVVLGLDAYLFALGRLPFDGDATVAGHLPNPTRYAEAPLRS